jgi:hypothetical protein
MALALAASGIGKSVATTFAKKFGVAVIERWTRHRAERFFEGFVEAVNVESSTGAQTEEVDSKLTAILADETKSEVLFDSYRRVCFSKSKTLGPRIIGLLTGQLVHQGRMADNNEECVFAAAELLSDGDFIEFMKGYQEHRKKAEGITDRKAEHCLLGDSVIVRWCEEKAWFSSWGGGDVDIGPFPWEDALGRWAMGLKQAGLIEERIQQATRQSPPSVQEGQGEQNLLIVTTTITFFPACVRLYDLLSRSLGAEKQSAESY